MPQRVRVWVPATTANLGPGFDVLGMALSLENEVEVTAAEGWEVRVEGEGAQEVPWDARNAVCQAMAFLFEQAGAQGPPLRVLCRNRIPLARGLGSSAAARLAGLAAANAWLGFPFEGTQLLRWAIRLEGHPDNVVPAWVGGVTVATLEDEEPVFLRLEPPEGLKAVVAVPDFPLPTEEARRALPSCYERSAAVFNVGRAALLVAALATGRVEMLRRAMQDRFHEPYRAPLVPGMEAVRRAALEAGAWGVALSGAGPSLMAFAGPQAPAVREAMLSAWREQGVAAQGWILEPQREGTRIEVEE